MNKLNDKAINIKGKQYVLISDRVLAFNENYPNGSISTELVSQASDDLVVIKATVLPDYNYPQRIFTGYSQATWGDGVVNKTAALENCETSAVGRALGFMGIGVIDSIASVDEINKATSQPEYKKKSGQATDGQRKFITDLMRDKGIDIETMQHQMGLKQGQKMDFNTASMAIEWLKGL